ncbi:hypothetical protein B0T13DRAFT_493030 [Neurospora crassa]|nr:hypothetical protein B0T13DRAFT_493030 [Neurospora crassa]
MVDETTKEVLECFPSVTNYERFEKTMDAIHYRSKVVLCRVLFDLFVSDISDPETLQSRIHELKRRGQETKKDRATYISEGPDECTRCEEEEFGPEDESKGCFHHPELNAPHHREENPDGFTWSCCGLPGGRRGCKRCPHKAYEGDTDYSGDSEDGDEVDDDSGK